MIEVLSGMIDRRKARRRSLYVAWVVHHSRSKRQLCIMTNMSYCAAEFVQLAGSIAMHCLAFELAVGASLQHWGSRQNAGCTEELLCQCPCVCVDIPSLGRSAPFDSTMGVKQGCPMFPTLFGLYIDQLETHLQYHAQDAPELQGQKVSILLYADDIVLMSRSPAGLQHLLYVLQLFCGEKLLSVNMSKTQVVIFNDFRHSHSDANARVSE